MLLIKEKLKDEILFTGMAISRRNYNDFQSTPNWFYAKRGWFSEQASFWQ
jgi:hypothetical protein